MGCRPREISLWGGRGVLYIFYSEKVCLCNTFCNEKMRSCNTFYSEMIPNTITMSSFMYPKLCYHTFPKHFTIIRHGLFSSHISVRVINGSKPMPS